MTPSELNEIDALFALPLESFTAERDRLAKRLVASGDKDGARVVKALRKPTVVAWTLNQLARSHRDGLSELFDTGRQMARALDDADPSRARDAQAHRRKLLRELGDAAIGILRDGGHAASATHVDKVRSILLQATTDEETAAEVTRGRLHREPRAEALPDAFDGLTATEDDDAPDAGEGRRRAQLEAKVERYRTEAEAAALEAGRRAREAESARVAADAAQDVAEAAQRAAERSLRHLEDAEDELRRAK